MLMCHDCFLTSIIVSPGMNHMDAGPGTVMWSQWSQNSHAGDGTVIGYLCTSWMACVAAVTRTQIMSSSNKTCHQRTVSMVMHAAALVQAPRAQSFT